MAHHKTLGIVPAEDSSPVNTRFDRRAGARVPNAGLLRLMVIYVRLTAGDANPKAVCRSIGLSHGMIAMSVMRGSLIHYEHRSSI